MINCYLLQTSCTKIATCYRYSIITFVEGICRTVIILDQNVQMRQLFLKNTRFTNFL